jgi:hypothetical protein
MGASITRQARRRGLQPAGFGAHDAAQRDAEDAGTPQVQPPGQDAVRVGLVKGGEPIQREAGVLRQIRHDAVGECPAVEGRRCCDRGVARPNQGLHLVARQPHRLAAIWEDHRRGGVRLVDGRDDVAVRDQLLDLEGVLLANAGKSVQEDQHRVAGLVICHGRGRDRVAGDVLEVAEGEPGQVERSRQLGRNSVGILHPGSARRCWGRLGWIPELHH